MFSLFSECQAFHIFLVLNFDLPRAHHVNAPPSNLPYGSVLNAPYMCICKFSGKAIAVLSVDIDLNLILNRFGVDANRFVSLRQ